MSHLATVTEEELRTILNAKYAEQKKNLTKSQHHVFKMCLCQKKLNVSIKNVSK